MVDRIARLIGVGRNFHRGGRGMRVRQDWSDTADAIGASPDKEMLAVADDEHQLAFPAEGKSFD